MQNLCEGEPKSQTNIGWLYHQGLSVEKDLEKAAEWYRKAAEQEYVIAQHNLGTMYEHGWGIEQSYAEAVKWYQFGVDKAYGPSLFNLGMLYLNGLGVKADRNIAIHHLRSAHALKVSEATNKLKELGVEIAEDTPISHTPQPQPARHHNLTRETKEP